MPEEITPQAIPIATQGEPTWYPPPQDDNEMHRPEPSGVHRVFYGQDGLRAGWSMLLFLLIFAALSGALVGAMLVVGLVHRALPGAQHIEGPVKTTLLIDGAQFAAAALAALVMSLVEKRKFARYGLGPLRQRAGQFVYGLIVGFATLSLLIGLLWKLHLLVFGGFLVHGAPILKWGCLWALAFLFVGLFEEYFTRGYLQFTLARGVAGVSGRLGMSERVRRFVGFWIAALFFSFIFGFGHKNNPGESPVGIVAAGLIGLVFAFSLWRTGSLWWAVGWHASWDWAESFFYGTADSGGLSQHRLLATHPQGPVLQSGGLTGPEGSVYVLLMILLTALVIAFTLKPQPGSPAAEFVTEQ